LSLSALKWFDMGVLSSRRWCVPGQLSGGAR
jgi:hypothetical protein